MTDPIPSVNRTLRLRERPTGRVGKEHFEVVEEAIPALADGEVLVEVHWLAFQPAQRSSLNDFKSYSAAMQIGEVMRSDAAGRIVASRHPDYPVGSLVMGAFGWQQYAVRTPDDQQRGINDFELLEPGTDLTLALSVLSDTGMTAYFGMTDVGRVQPGDTVLVTAAAGAVGSLAGQIARATGAARVIGTASTEEKRAWVREVAGFDDCLDYRDPKIFRLLRAAAPDGYDVVFDNVGGELLDNSLALIAERARVVLCGSISTGYRPERPEVGLRNYQFLTTRRGTMQGFIVFDYATQYGQARAELQRWVADGTVRHTIDIVEGLEHAPETLQRLFDGGNLGKQLLRVR